MYNSLTIRREGPDEEAQNVSHLHIIGIIYISELANAVVVGIETIPHFRRITEDGRILVHDLGTVSLGFENELVGQYHFTNSHLA